MEKLPESKCATRFQNSFHLARNIGRVCAGVPLNMKRGMLKVYLEAFSVKKSTLRTWIILIIQFPISIQTWGQRSLFCSSPQPFLSLVCSEHSIRSESAYMNRRGG